MVFEWLVLIVSVLISVSLVVPYLFFAGAVVGSMVTPFSALFLGMGRVATSIPIVKNQETKSKIILLNKKRKAKAGPKTNQRRRGTLPDHQQAIL